MRSYSAAVEAQLAAKKIRKRLAIRFDLPSGNYGFVTGVRGSLTVGGVLYVGSGGLIEIDQPENKITAEADEIAVSLASHRKINGVVAQLFDPHLLDTIEDEVWFLRPAIVYRFWMDVGGLVADVEQLHIRQIFSIEHLKSRNGRRIKARLLTPAALAKVFEAKRNGPDLQKLIDPADTSYDDILATVTDPIYWGRATPKPATNRQRG